MTTLRDALSEAIGKAEALDTPTEVSTVETPVVEAAEVSGETSEQREARLRDEKGRFARVEEQPKPAKPVEAQAQPVVVSDARKPPSSWKKDYWGHWDRLGKDPELKTLQDYIEQREADYAKGVSTYKSQWDQVAPIQEAMRPFEPELQQYGIQPAQWIQNLGNAHRTLALGSPQQKLQMFAKLATDYGIPLQALQPGAQGDPQSAHVMRTVSDLQREVQNFKNQQHVAEQTRLQQEIQAFQADAPHFEAVKGTMAQLLQSGVASDLKTAYGKAIRLHDDVWQQEQARQAQDAAAKREAELARKKAAAVSPKSSGPTGQIATGNTKKSLKEQLSEAMESHSDGRF